VAIAGTERVVLGKGVGLELDAILSLNEALKKEGGTVVKVRSTVSGANDPLHVLELARTKTRLSKEGLQLKDRGSPRWNRHTARTKKASVPLDASEQKLSM
jgi:hypothetical protein